LLRAWEFTAEAFQKDKTQLGEEVARLKRACEDNKEQELHGRHELTQKSAELAEVERALIKQLDTLHKQNESLSEDLELKRSSTDKRSHGAAGFCQSITRGYFR
jgi:hypothetical protein